MPTRTPIKKFQSVSSSISSQSTHTSWSSNVSDSTTSYIRYRETISLREIYEDLDVHLNFSLFVCQPTCFEEAIKDKNLVQAMDEEIYSIENNDTCDLVEFLEEKDCIGVKWVYKTKFNEKEEVEKHMARLVENVFSQQPLVDYSESIAPIARLYTLKLVLAMVGQNM
jgi:hypothetical protein